MYELFFTVIHLLFQLFNLLNSLLLLKLYVHCNVLLSDQGVTTGSKSCNYNVTQSRYLYTQNCIL